jgi:hypothetical protein
VTLPAAGPDGKPVAKEFDFDSGAEGCR